MATQAEALANVEAIEEAMAQNVREVEFADGRTVIFSSFEELHQRWQFWRMQAGLEAGRQRLLGKFKRGVTT